ncbi:hypothetical protein AVEN_247502-1 [Araneus ventricosus]|uniref:Uncharacterized protein n=1 Tax=Araneus ventricosus TaxID=182803 RepID=A0A4Y2LHB1_ARAVE|nr:hypothetical protein AVEN_247502-1 [Araneus ventricosus]
MCHWDRRQLPVWQSTTADRHYAGFTSEKKGKKPRRRPTKIDACERVSRIRCVTSNANKKSVPMPGAVGFHVPLGSPAGDGFGNQRQPIHILPLSVRVQAPIQLFMPLKECGRPIL